MNHSYLPRQGSFFMFKSASESAGVKTLSMAVTTGHTGSPNRQTTPGNRTRPCAGVKNKTKGKQTNHYNGKQIAIGIKGTP